MKNHENDLRIFFGYIMVYSIVALATVNFEGKTRSEILNVLFLRYISGLLIGIFCSVGSLIGKAIFYYLQNKYKKNEKHNLK